jgi:hypothetical protein
MLQQMPLSQSQQLPDTAFLASLFVASRSNDNARDLSMSPPVPLRAIPSQHDFARHRLVRWPSMRPVTFQRKGLESDYPD